MRFVILVAIALFFIPTPSAGAEKCDEQALGAHRLDMLNELLKADPTKESTYNRHFAAYWSAGTEHENCAAKLHRRQWTLLKRPSGPALVKVKKTVSPR